MRQVKPEMITKQFHCPIHQENLFGKLSKTQNVMAVVTKTVTFIRSKGLCRREFREQLRSMNADFEDIPYYIKVRSLSCGKTLKRVFELKDAIQASLSPRMFIKGKGNPIAEFNNLELIEYFAFLVDVTTHLNELNSRLPRKGQLIPSMFDHVNAFVTKLALWETQIKNQNFIHFPTLKSLEV